MMSDTEATARIKINALRLGQSTTVVAQSARKRVDGGGGDNLINSFISSVLDGAPSTDSTNTHLHDGN